MANQIGANVTIVSASKIDIHVGSRLQVLRKNASLTVQLLADAVEIAEEVLVKMEAGHLRVPAVTLYAIAKVLGVKTAYFFDEAE